MVAVSLPWYRYVEPAGVYSPLWPQSQATFKQAEVKLTCHPRAIYDDLPLQKLIHAISPSHLNFSCV